MRPLLTATSLALVFAWTPLAAADRSFELPPISALDASPEADRALLLDERTGERRSVYIGDSYAGTFRLIDIDAARIVLKESTRDDTYYVLPVHGAERAERQRERRASRGQDAGDLIDPYGSGEDSNTRGEPGRAPHPSATIDPYGSGEDSDSVRTVPAPDRARAGHRRADAERDEPSERPSERDERHQDERADSEESDRRGTGQDDRRDDSPATPAERRELSRAAIDAALADLDDLERQAEVRAEPEGVRIVRLDSDSFVHELGFRQGDLIRRVAGRTLDSVEAAAALYAHLARAEEVTVLLERAEREIRLEFDLVP